ncbi:MAG: LysR family transcriptional regulator [Nitrososphaerota archaeon]|nr:LysR family transcriptional regulator [Candidatus Bathyarchaeota archaeon]MDW8024180.1 LysR family transcriptional regulator [Nitrososphaerota archaeon]
MKIRVKTALRIEYLKTFTTVVKTGRFLAAAKELRLSQATVTNHIALLEKYFDARLLNRTVKGVELTDAGKILKDSAEKIIKEVENAKAQISTLKMDGLIKIAASTIPGEHIIPSIIAEFKKSKPEANFKITITDTVNALKSLENNTANFAAVGSLIGYEGEFEKIVLAEEEFVLAVPPNHELANRESVELFEILNHPYINREETSGTRKEVERMLKESGINPQELKTVMELGSTQSIITAVSDGRGISIISSIAARKAEKSGLLKTVKICNAKNKRKLYMVRQKGKLSNICENFWEFCKTLTV